MTFQFPSTTTPFPAAFRPVAFRPLASRPVAFRPAVAALAAALSLITTTSWPAESGARTASHARAKAASQAELLPPRVPGGGPPEEQTVYRCGSNYSPRPCAGAKPLDIADPRTTAQRLQAADVADRDKHLAAWLEAQRHRRDDPASAPRKSRTRASEACASTARVACSPKPPRPHTAVVKKKTTRKKADPAASPASPASAAS